MGAVDLVIQVESPKSVARGLQRIGRAGHDLHSVSRGRIFPKFRGDLLESAVVARAMREGAIEETRIPRNPLDVLAQQIVAICADEEVSVDELHELVLRAYPFSDLSRAQLENVLDMLAGRYPSDEFAELRPRVVWDRTAGVVRGRTGARKLAVTNAGTIPDRGLFGVHLVDGGGRVGELDEEMVYEAREGQTFLLGASTWRIEDITRDRVLVSPGAGGARRGAVLEGRGGGRPAELGEKIGQASRSLVAMSDEKATTALEADYNLDSRAARNLVTFLREQENATGVVPSDRSIVVERFRDEIGDWRVCVLTPFGGRVHAPWAMALAARLRDSLDVEAQSIWSDDGIALHFPDADVPPPLADLLLDPDEIEELVLGELASSALFGSRFRENASRALLIPRRRPGQRTPLWQQRLKAQSLLQVARRYPQFPIVLETYREVLQDVFDLPSLRKILRGIQTREIDLVEAETASASPFASSLLFDYVATYMYEDDTPPEERRAQALSLDRGLLRELMGVEELRELLDAGAIADVEASLRPVPRNADELHDLLRRAGPLLAGEYDAGFAETLLRERRALRVRLGDAEPLLAAEDAGLVRDAFGAALPGGVPQAFLDPVPDALRVRVAQVRADERAVHDVGGRGALRPRSRAGGGRAGGARAGREARPRRAAARRQRARVVRPRRPAPHQARDARGAPARGRARRAGVVRPLPSLLARDRTAADAAGGARAPPDARAPGLPLGERRASPPRPRLSPRGSRRALRLGRRRLGRSGARPGRRLLPRGRRAPRAARRRGRAGGCRCRRDSGCTRPGRALLGATCSARPSSTRVKRSRRSGTSSGRARSRTTPGRRCARAAGTRLRVRSEAGAGSSARGWRRLRRRRAAGPSRLGSSPLPARSRRRAIGARSPSSCSSGRGS